MVFLPTNTLLPACCGLNVSSKFYEFTGTLITSAAVLRGGPNKWCLGHEGINAIILGSSELS